MVKKLLENGFDAETPDYKGRCILDVALEMTDNLEMVKLIIEHLKGKGDVTGRVISWVRFGNKSPLEYDRALAEVADQEGLNIAFRDAVWGGKGDAARMLLEMGADPFIEDDGHNDENSISRRADYYALENDDLELFKHIRVYQRYKYLMLVKQVQPFIESIIHRIAKVPEHLRRAILLYV